MKSFKKFFLFFILLFIFSFNSFADQQAKPYSNEEFSQTAKDIRRFEIITLGSLPFITFDAVLVYSGIKWSKNDFQGSFPNPFSAKSSLSNEEMTGIILTSLGICLGIAITDLVINIVKRNQNQVQEQKQILILPEELNPSVETIQEE